MLQLSEVGFCLVWGFFNKELSIYDLILCSWYFVLIYHCLSECDLEAAQEVSVTDGSIAEIPSVSAKLSCWPGYVTRFW